MLCHGYASPLAAFRAVFGRIPSTCRTSTLASQVGLRLGFSAAYSRIRSNRLGAEFARAGLPNSWLDLSSELSVSSGELRFHSRPLLVALDTFVRLSVLTIHGSFVSLTIPTLLTIFLAGF